MDTQKTRDNSHDPPDVAPRRRPYVKPELVGYGPLAKLTRGNGSGSAEGGSGMMKCL